MGCTKPHHGADDHGIKCTNWICPEGLRYRNWADVQAYFQLLHFEEDIPGVECRPENARRSLAEGEEEITLEEATNKEVEEKEKLVKQQGVKKEQPKRQQKG